MRNVWAIFLQDLRNIKRVPLVGLLLIGLAILPSLYAWFNLSAAWDPYSNTQGIQVAVVNEDEGTEIEGEYVNIGEELIRSLAGNENLGWVFVSREQAEKGVRYGDYYAGLYIDQHFSRHLAQVITGDPVQAEVFYQVNEKVNAIAPKMTSTGASTIVKEINAQFIAETSQVLFHEFDKLGIRLEEELPTFRKIKLAIYELEKRFPEVNEFADWLITLDENWDQVEEQVDRLLAIEGHLPQIHEGAEQILRIEKLFPELYKLGDGILQLEDAIPEIELAVEELDKINDRFAEVKEQLQRSLEATQQAQLSIKSAQDSLSVAWKRVESTQAYVEALDVFIEETQLAADPIIDTLAQQLLFMNQTAAAVNHALAMVEDEQSLEQVEDVIESIDHQLTAHLEMLESAIEMYSRLYEVSGEESLLPMIERLTGTKDGLERMKEQVPQVDLSNPERVEVARQNAEQVERATNELYSLLKGDGPAELERAINGVHSALKQQSFDEAYSKLDSLEEVLSHAESITATGEETIAELIERLPEIETRLNELIDRVQEDLPTVIVVIEALGQFVKQDLPVIEEQVKRVTAFIREDLPEAEQTYLHIASLLKENVPNIQQSIHELANFGRQHLPEIEVNIGEAARRIHQMEDDNRINEIISMLRNDLDQESDFFASPVLLSEEQLFPIPNYGSANVPFYTTLSLWVGALLLSNLVSTNLHGADRREPFTLRQIYFGRMILFLIVGVLQGLIVSIGNLTLLGIYAAHPLLLILFSVLIAIIFMTIVYTCASILGNIGKALAIVLLVLQLSSGGGTFPVEVIPPFFQAIHPFMPFSYAINLLREAVGGVIPILVWRNIAVLVCFWLLAIAIGVLLKPLFDKRIQATSDKAKSSRLIE
ncbi:YhgE/Pip domain-containing protein [Halalkalibacter krulwichiae]|uniref:YhgE/Pip domain-containing protein n=1 Tax=Halalkalibacter krulwichiae TaxID=199441 RepID=UPI00082718AF|nr:YhgE/Pip domain-containing protein [Halalkalibacter krulwichiae]